MFGYTVLEFVISVLIVSAPIALALFSVALFCDYWYATVPVEKRIVRNIKIRAHKARKEA